MDASEVIVNLETRLGQKVERFGHDILYFTQSVIVGLA